ncbi:MAG: leucine-rich repeat domain-containing protein [Clostridia bacterium]|nr:leucine-rich repeat domain-containing protein [Clostridia bacterium]
MKKAISIFLSVLLLMAAFPASAISVFAATTGTTGDCTWTLDDNGHLTISGNGAMKQYYSHAATGPWGADITSVTIENGVTNISDWAFAYCKSLTSIIIPDSVTTIGEHAFYWCETLVSVSGGDSITSIGRYAFYSCFKLTAAPLPDSVTSIGNGAFYDCDTLKTVTIPVGVTDIGYATFSWCSSLSEVNIPESVTSIGGNAFYHCGQLKTVNIPDGVVSIGSGAFTGCPLTTVSIPKGITSIEATVFKECTKLTSIIIPISVKSIGYESFGSCWSLKNVYYEGTVEEKERITIDSRYNSYLRNATWHYNCINPKYHYAPNVDHSVMETEQGNGLAFRFTLSVDGMGVVKGNEVDFTNATINYLGEDCKVVGMGAVVTNDASIALGGKLTSNAANGRTAIDIAAVYLQDLEPDSCAFAVRIKNIPDTQLESTIYARPYYIVELEGQPIVIYGDINSSSCVEYL